MSDNSARVLIVSIQEESSKEKAEECKENNFVVCSDASIGFDLKAFRESSRIKLVRSPSRAGKLEV